MNPNQREKNIIEESDNYDRLMILKKTRKITDPNFLLNLAEWENFDVPEFSFLQESLEKDKKTRNSMDLQILMKYLLKTKIKDLLQEYKPTDFEYTFILYNIAKNLDYKKIKKGEIVFRIGDPGDKFYVILSGTVSILKLFEKEIYCTVEQYIEKLMELKKENEKFITQRTILLNKEKAYIDYKKIENVLEKIFLKKLYKSIKLNYTIEEIKQIFKDYKRHADDYNINLITLKNFELDKKIINNNSTSYMKYKSQILTNLLSMFNNLNNQETNIDNNTNINTLINLNYLNNIDNEESDGTFKMEYLEEKKRFLISKYEQFFNLTTGLYFGDFAIDTNTTRNATLMSVGDETHLGILDKEVYREFILKEKLRIENKKISFLYEIYFCKFLSRINFEKKYYKNFIYQEFSKGQVLFKEKQNLDYIYIINDGKLDLSIEKNYFSLIEEIDKILKINPHISKNYKENLKNLDRGSIENKTGSMGIFFKENDAKNLDNQLQKKKNLLFAKISNKEIIGMENFFFNFPLHYKATVMSDKFYCFKIDIKNFERIIMQEKVGFSLFEDISIKKLVTYALRVKELSRSFLEMTKFHDYYEKKLIFKDQMEDRMKNVIKNKNDRILEKKLSHTITLNTINKTSLIVNSNLEANPNIRNSFSKNDKRNNIDDMQNNKENFNRKETNYNVCKNFSKKIVNYDEEKISFKKNVLNEKKPLKLKSDEDDKFFYESDGSDGLKIIKQKLGKNQLSEDQIHYDRRIINQNSFEQNSIDKLSNNAFFKNKNLNLYLNNMDDTKRKIEEEIYLKNKNDSIQKDEMHIDYYLTSKNKTNKKCKYNDNDNNLNVENSQEIFPENKPNKHPLIIDTNQIAKTETDFNDFHNNHLNENNNESFTNTNIIEHKFINVDKTKIFKRFSEINLNNKNSLKINNNLHEMENTKSNVNDSNIYSIFNFKTEKNPCIINNQDNKTRTIGSYVNKFNNLDKIKNKNFDENIEIKEKKRKKFTIEINSEDCEKEIDQNTQTYNLDKLQMDLILDKIRRTSNSNFMKSVEYNKSLVQNENLPSIVTNINFNFKAVGEMNLDSINLNESKEVSKKDLNLFTKMCFNRDFKKKKDTKITNLLKDYTKNYFFKCRKSDKIEKLKLVNSKSNSVRKSFIDSINKFSDLMNIPSTRIMKNSLNINIFSQNTNQNFGLKNKNGSKIEDFYKKNSSKIVKGKDIINSFRINNLDDNQNENQVKSQNSSFDNNLDKKRNCTSNNLMTALKSPTTSCRCMTTLDNLIITNNDDNNKRKFYKNSINVSENSKFIKKRKIRKKIFKDILTWNTNK